jgi:hypothetical protein
VFPNGRIVISSEREDRALRPPAPAPDQIRSSSGGPHNKIRTALSAPRRCPVFHHVWLHFSLGCSAARSTPKNGLLPAWFSGAVMLPAARAFPFVLCRPEIISLMDGKEMKKETKEKKKMKGEEGERGERVCVW